MWQAIKAFHALPHFILVTLWSSISKTFILYTWQLMLGEGKEITQGHTACKSPHQESGPYNLTREAFVIAQGSILFCVLGKGVWVGKGRRGQNSSGWMGRRKKEENQRMQKTSFPSFSYCSPFPNNLVLNPFVGREAGMCSGENGEPRIRTQGRQEEGTIARGRGVQPSVRTWVRRDSKKRGAGGRAR